MTNHRKLSITNENINTFCCLLSFLLFIQLVPSVVEWKLFYIYKSTFEIHTRTRARTHTHLLLYKNTSKIYLLTTWCIQYLFSVNIIVLMCSVYLYLDLYNVFNIVYFVFIFMYWFLLFFCIFYMHFLFQMTLYTHTHTHTSV